MKSIRDVKILMKNSLLSPDVKFQVAHADKNLIDLEESEESSSSTYEESKDKITQNIENEERADSSRALVDGEIQEQKHTSNID